MNLPTLTLLSAVAAIASATALHATVPDLAVAGFKIGMSEDDALAALKSHNARFVINEPALDIQGFSESLKPIATAQALANGDLNGENISLLFTMPPGPTVLWGVQRAMNYVPAHRPALDASLAALRQKYGPESIPPLVGTGVANLAWIFDADGNLLSRAAGWGLYMRCTSLLQGHFGMPQQIFNDLQLGFNGARAEEGKITLITASVQYTQEATTSVVYNLIVTINAGPIYVPSLLATRENVLKAVNSQNAKQNKDIDARGGPSL
jgi:hypothetical protein